MSSAKIETTPVHAEETPGSGARSTLLPWTVLLGASIVVGLWSWLRVDGALFADVVEYLERARGFVRGEDLIDAQEIRAAGVTVLHAPVLWLAQLVGLADGRWVLGYAAVVHVVVTALFLVATVHLARHLALASGVDARRTHAAGWFAGTVALACPTLAQFAAIPMTDIAAGAALACGMTAFFFGPTTPRGGAVAGAWMGLAALCAFKAIPLVAATVAAGLVLRAVLDGTRVALRCTGAALASLAAFALVQCTFDLVTYGTFGIGLGRYLAINIGPTVGGWLYQVGFIDLGQRLYHFARELLDQTLVLDDVSRSTDDFASVAPRTWYLDHIQWFAARWIVPVAALGSVVAIAAGRGARGSFLRRSAVSVRGAAPLLIAVPFLLATGAKGAKEMRIWLPFLPVFAAYAGLGMVALTGAAAARGARPRAALAATLLLAALTQAAVLVSASPRAPFAAFERAAAWLENATDDATGATDGRPLVASSYHWAVLFRTPSNWTLEKLPHQLDQLPALEDPAERERTLDRMRAQDALLIQTSVLNGPRAADITELLAAEFHVAAAFWDRSVDTGIGAVIVFTRAVPTGVRRRVLHGRTSTPAALTGLRLERQLSLDRELVRLSGLRVTRLPGDGLDWVEVDIDQRGEKLIGGYSLALRVSDATGTRGFTEWRNPGWGKQDIRELPQGVRWTEGFLVAPTQGPAALNVPFGALRGGERAHLWFDLVTLDADAAGRRIVTGRLEALMPGSDHAERDDVDPRTGRSDDGWRFSPSHGELHVASYDVGGDAVALRLESALIAE